jgi:hypothetical protein
MDWNRVTWAIKVDTSYFSVLQERLFSLFSHGGTFFSYLTPKFQASKFGLLAVLDIL